MASKQLKVPQSAFFTPLAAVQFAAGEAPAGSNGVPAAVPFTSVVRSAEPIVHWYWGKIVHDMAGMQLRKDNCPVDYCHDCEEIIGVGLKFTVDDKVGVTVEGKLIPFTATDRAAEVIFKSREGIPYEASIDWSGPRAVEYVDTGVSTFVNGQQFDGPGYIVRKWQLNAFAVCPLGADENTSTQFSRKGKEVDVVVEFSGPETQFTEPHMTTTPTNPPASAATNLSPEGTKLSATDQVKAEMAIFCTHFGHAKGAEYFMSGKSLVECFSAHLADVTKAHGAEVEQFNKTIAEKDAELTKVNTEFKAWKDKFSGEAPVSFGEGGTPQKPTQFGAGLLDVVKVPGGKK